MHRIYISIGSNVDSEKHIRAAVNLLQDHYGDLHLSTVYESEAIGFEGDNFFNLVARFDTEEDIEAVAKSLCNIEAQYGRSRSEPRFSSRTLDLDLLLYDDVIIKSSDLEIPRNEITNNAFVLRPLVEMAPRLIHPRLDVTMEELWKNFDKSSQNLWPVDFQW